jgi:outer membrane receptor for ferrienterochelin and colicins
MKKSILLLSCISQFVIAQTKTDTLPKTEKKLFQLDEVFVSGTLKAVKRLENSVPVEIITTPFLKQNPTSNVFDVLQNVNGLRSQNNCNLCGTGDIRINDLDRMPIMIGLGTVYGLSGIPK